MSSTFGGLVDTIDLRTDSFAVRCAVAMAVIVKKITDVGALRSEQEKSGSDDENPCAIALQLVSFCIHKLSMRCHFMNLNPQNSVRNRRIAVD